MHRAHKIRLNPTLEQVIYFRKACGTTRFAFNWGLAEIKLALKEGRKPEHWMALKKRFNAIKREKYPWVYEVTKCAVEAGFENLGSALSNFLASKRGKRKGPCMKFPRFKRKKRGRGSFGIANDKFQVIDHIIIVPCLGAVNMTEALRFEGKIIGATISQQSGYWWVSIQVDVPHIPQQRRKQAIGVDVGIKVRAITNDGQVFENQKHLSKALRKLARLQRTISRRQKGSKNRERAIEKLVRAHYRVTNLRSDAIHKLTTALARRATLIGIEDLNIKGLLQNRKLARALGDASLGEIHRQLHYKAEWYGGVVIEVGQFFPSSKLHYGCGGLKEDLRLSEREWLCPRCGVWVNRDRNAACNIRAEAVRLYQAGPALAAG